MSGTSSPRALIDIGGRSSSRDGGLLRSTNSSSRASTPSHSPFASPVSSPPLRSAMKPRPSPSVADTASAGFDFSDKSVSTLDVGHGDEHRGRTGAAYAAALPASGLVAATTSSGSLGSMYSRRVGFDTFDSGLELDQTGSSTGGGTGVNYSFTLSAKSAAFVRTKQTRTYMVGTDLNGYSVHALDWVLSSLADDNDEIVVLRVIDPTEKTKPGGMAEAKDEAEQVLEEIMRKNGEELPLSIIVEFAIGPIEETIHRMIEIYRPDSLIVGTRGLPDSIFKSAFMGSISRYCVAKSPVPVVVVRPEDKVRESLNRRLNEPKKRSYLSLLSPSVQQDLALAAGQQNLDLERSTSATATVGQRPQAPGEDAKKATKKGLEFKKFSTFS